MKKSNISGTGDKRNVNPNLFTGKTWMKVLSEKIKAKDQDDAMRISNDSRFGLGGGIFSKDEDKAIELAQNHFDTGMVFINSFGLAQVDMPFGGVKDSGFGREHGGFGIKEFVNAKAINILK